MFFLKKNSPDSGFVPLLVTRVAPETDGPHQLPFGKGAQNEVVIAGGG
jgi:hypothetical protein